MIVPNDASSPNFPDLKDRSPLPESQVRMTADRCGVHGEFFANSIIVCPLLAEKRIRILNNLQITLSASTSKGEK